MLGKTEGKTQLGRPGRACEDNVQIDITEKMWDGVDWIEPAQDRDQWWDVVNTVVNRLVPRKWGNFLTS